MSDELLTVAEACAFLKMSRSAFYSWRLRKRIPNAINSRTLRFRRLDLVRARVTPVDDHRSIAPPDCGAWTKEQWDDFATRFARGEWPRA